MALMTERLYYHDTYLREWTARIAARSEDGLTVYLDRTAFYPASGGQPCDTGRIGGAAVIDVAEEEDRIAHRLAAPGPAAGDEVACVVDWDRRFDHMQQHSGQHLLSAVFGERFGLRTVSFHLGAESATIDLEGGPLDARIAAEAERLANEEVFASRPVTVTFEDAAEASGLRKPSGREGRLRIVSIEGVDRSACGGTHVRATGEIGPVLLRKLDRIRQSVRVEFLCGRRAVARARADYEALSRVAHLFSAAPDEVSAMAAAQLESARAGEKARRKLEIELAGYQGRELWETTSPGADGVRRLTRRAPRGSLDELRALAQSFTSKPGAVFLAALEEPPSVMLAASEDAGVDAGRALKAAVTAEGGRGGGTARMAQGSVAGVDALERVLAALG
jgi:alanyl-tRNA synthetase